MSVAIVVMGLKSSGKSTTIYSILGRSVEEMDPTIIDAYELRFEDTYMVEIGGEVLERLLTEYVSKKKKDISEIWDFIIDRVAEAIAKRANKTKDEVLSELKITNIVLTLDGGTSIEYVKRLTKKTKMKTEEKVEKAKIDKQEELFKFLEHSVEVFKSSKPDQFIHNFQEMFIPVFNKSDKLTAQDAKEVIDTIMEKLGPLARKDIELRYKIISALGIQVPIKELTGAFYNDDELEAYRNVERLKELGILDVWDQYLAMNAIVSLSAHGVTFNKEINKHLETIVEHLKKELMLEISEADGFPELVNYEELGEKIEESRLQHELEGKIKREKKEIRMHIERGL